MELPRLLARRSDPSEPKILSKYLNHNSNLKPNQKSMRLTKILAAIIVPFISLTPQFTTIANAQSEQSIVRGSCNAAITALEKGSRVNMRSGPGVEFDVVGYVLVGQRVNKLRYEIGAAVRESDGEGVYWDYVEYVPSETRGWIVNTYLGKCR
jgi:hypothetical protein